MSTLHHSDIMWNITTTIEPEHTDDPTSLMLAMDKYISSIHGPLALTVCIIGIVMNIINIAVLSDKEMLSSVNRLLQAIAVADLITMLDYIPYSILFFIKHGTNVSVERNNQPAVNYLFFHAVCSIVSHTASIWLTVCVALFRYIYLSSSRGKELCALSRANLTIGLVCIVSFLLSLPQILVLKVNESIDPKTNETSYWYLWTNGMPKHQKAINKAGYIIMAVLVKIGPSILLILLSLLLISIILKVQRRYQKIHTQQSKKSNASATEKKRQEQTNQTTKLLICVAIVFTIVELPQGILFVCNGIAPKKFEKVYYPLGNLFDLMTIISCGVNFVLYCAMSTQFRKIFVRNLKTLIKVESCAKSNSELTSQRSTSGADETVHQPLCNVGGPIASGTNSTIVSNGDAFLDQNQTNGCAQTSLINSE